jgi:hypothetical protein
VGHGEIGHELPLTTAGRDIKAAIDKTMSSATVTKIEMRRRELDPEFVCIGESSILRMDFQPVLAKTVRSQPHIWRQRLRGIFWGKNFGARIYTPNVVTVLQPQNRVNGTIFSVKNFAY